jgi:mRNA interferase RelE/StbE
VTSEPAEAFEIHWASPAGRALRRLPEKVATAAIEFSYGPLAGNPSRVGWPLRFELEGR